ncbi:DUF2510 domain-containing protein [Microbacterium sp. MYb45]|uniref:DUF2510 domain-containing protein n=1 Tax=Microbacterium sp. MYb45 TaxID=1827294 RepID=UPI000CFF87C8|nr:DUF2510 domain-containing protein [Microbacterium sp. MYb45]PRB63062.1 hypothetical protein CQ034_09465 [Microbacterium sp. MYb45]
MSTTPAGWYDDGSGRQRWWDGEQWTEHFAPDATAAADAESAPVAPDAAEASTGIETPATDAPAVDEEPSYDAPEAPSTDDTVIRTSAEAPTAATTPLGDDVAAYAAPAAPDYSPTATPEQPVSSYPGAAPAYPGAGAASGYPAAAPYVQTEPEAPKKPSVLGLVGLGLSAVGTILAFIPLIGFIGFILLGAGFIVSLISLFLKGKKWPGITGLILSVVGGIISAVMFFVFFFAIAQNASEEMNNLPSSSPSIEATEPGETDGTDGADDGTRPTSAEVAVGLTAILAAEGTEGYTEPQITCLSDLLVESELDNSTLRAIAESDGTLTDVDAAYGFAEVLGDTEAITACFVP